MAVDYLGEIPPELIPPEDYGASELDPNLTLPPELCEECKKLGYCKDQKKLKEQGFIDGIVCWNISPLD